MKVAVIFGGSGFVGVFFAKHLIDQKKFTKVYLLDIENVASKHVSYRDMVLSQYTQIKEINCDVRQEIKINISEKIDLIANFAAIHREPGHESIEYFETNIKGAENVTKYAEQINCENIIFTSSISPYGISESEKDEYTQVNPATPYGSSKFSAEKIHEIWQKKSNTRKLMIVRPGVIYGPGEGGNVTRLIKALKGKYFVYTGNKKTVKAGIYIKELCNMMTWVMDNILTSRNFFLFNATYDPSPSLENYVFNIKKVLNSGFPVFQIPYFILLFASFLITFIFGLLRVKHPFSPVRIRKLVRSNKIKPVAINEAGYSYLYNTEQTFFDWKEEFKNDW